MFQASLNPLDEVSWGINGNELCGQPSVFLGSCIFLKENADTWPSTSQIMTLAVSALTKVEKERQNHAPASLVKIIIKRNFLFQIKSEQL